MKSYIPFLILCYSSIAAAQPISQTEHVFVITTDGFRWQEVFNGADSSMISDDRLVMDKKLIREQFWESSTDLRRKKLLPFFWNVIAEQGLLMGNRHYENKVGVSNIYKISYPGYNEILTGYADPLLNPNLRLNNKNRNVLEFLNEIPKYRGRVAVFASWNVFPFIVNEKRTRLPVNGGYAAMNETGDSVYTILNLLQKEVKEKSSTRYDLLTFCAAKEYIMKKHPAVVFIGFGETDEAAHQGRYDLYLQHASAVDRMISELWYFVQTDPEYKDHTTFIITTDHGRGRDDGSWHNHGTFTKGSGETWLACIGAGIQAQGEMKKGDQVYARQFAATISNLLGEDYRSDRTVGKPILFHSADLEIQTSIAGQTK